MTNPQIAARLFIARGTVKMHLSRAYRKLGVKNRTGLAAAAMATHMSDLRSCGQVADVVLAAEE